MSLPVLMNVLATLTGQGVVELTRAAADAGCTGVGLADSPRLFADPFVATEAVLGAHEVSLAGPCVAGLGLRPAGTVAGALATLARRHPGRVLAVVGRGESSVRNEGLPVPGLAQHAGALSALRDLLVDQPGGAPAVLLGAASGPRTIELTAATLGGVLLDVGADPNTVARAADRARSADPDSTIWLFLRAVVTRTEAESAAALNPILGSCAARMVAAPRWYGLDPADLAAVRSVAEAHDYTRHGRSAQGADPPVDAEAEALVRSRFLVSGLPAQIQSDLRPLAGLGIAGIVLAGGVTGVWNDLSALVAAVRSGLLPGGAT